MAVQSRKDFEDAHEVVEGDHGRGKNGRFRKGSSGNPAGRPRTMKAPRPTSFPAAMAQMLAEPVKIRRHGKQQDIPRFHLLAMRTISEVIDAPLELKMKAFTFWYRSGIINGVSDLLSYREELADLNSGPRWTPELEEQYRLVVGTYEDIDEPLVCEKCRASCAAPASDSDTVDDDDLGRTNIDDLGRWDGPESERVR